MKYAILPFLLILCAQAGCAQGSGGNNPGNGQKTVGGRCEGCEAIHESTVPFKDLNHIDTLPDFGDPGPKLGISGTVYRQDGKTPAGNVVIYIYHTDQQGQYPKKGDEKGWGQRHGYIRGWVKTNEKGEYRFYTLRPGAYPGGDNPQHIHVTVKEPDKNEYYIDDFHFADDPILKRSGHSFGNRGGNGVVQTKLQNGMETATRDIILGKNIPDYPK